MKITIKNLDPTGAVVEAEEFNSSVILERTKENGYYDKVQPDRTVFHYEPMKQNRYFLYICGYIYRLNDRTGELELIKKGED